LKGTSQFNWVGVNAEFRKNRTLVRRETDKDTKWPELEALLAFAEFERALIRERQREGIALAKKRGAYPWPQESAIT